MRIDLIHQSSIGWEKHFTALNDDDVLRMMETPGLGVKSCIGNLKLYQKRKAPFLGDDKVVAAWKIINTGMAVVVLLAGTEFEGEKQFQDLGRIIRACQAGEWYLIAVYEPPPVRLPEASSSPILLGNQQYNLYEEEKPDELLLPSEEEMSGLIVPIGSDPETTGDILLKDEVSDAN